MMMLLPTWSGAFLTTRQFSPRVRRVRRTQCQEPFEGYESPGHLHPTSQSNRLRARFLRSGHTKVIGAHQLRRVLFQHSLQFLVYIGQLLGLLLQFGLNIL